MRLLLPTLALARSSPGAGKRPTARGGVRVKPDEAGAESSRPWMPETRPFADESRAVLVVLARIDFVSERSRMIGARDPFFRVPQLAQKRRREPRPRRGELAQLAH